MWFLFPNFCLLACAERVQRGETLLLSFDRKTKKRKSWRNWPASREMLRERDWQSSASLISARQTARNCGGFVGFVHVGVRFQLLQGWRAFWCHLWKAAEISQTFFFGVSSKGLNPPWWQWSRPFLALEMGFDALNINRCRVFFGLHQLQRQSSFQKCGPGMKVRQQRRKLKKSPTTLRCGRCQWLVKTSSDFPLKSGVYEKKTRWNHFNGTLINQPAMGVPPSPWKHWGRDDERLEPEVADDASAPRRVFRCLPGGKKVQCTIGVYMGFLHRVFMWGLWFRWQERERRRAREASLRPRYRSEHVGIYQQLMDSWMNFHRENDGYPGKIIITNSQWMFCYLFISTFWLGENNDYPVEFWHIQSSDKATDCNPMFDPWWCNVMQWVCLIHCHHLDSIPIFGVGYKVCIFLINGDSLYHINSAIGSLAVWTFWGCQW